MLRKVAVLLIATICLMSVANAELIELNPENFGKIVKDNKKNVFVMFYAPWCGHCNNMKPAWAELADQYPISGDTLIARIDASTHREIGQSNNVEGFPTLKLFTKANKEGIPYEGARDAASLKAFLEKNIA